MVPSIRELNTSVLFYPLPRTSRKVNQENRKPVCIGKFNTYIFRQEIIERNLNSRTILYHFFFFFFYISKKENEKKENGNCWN